MSTNHAEDLATEQRFGADHASAAEWRDWRSNKATGAPHHGATGATNSLRLSLRTKLLSCFSVVLVMALAMGIVSVVQSKKAVTATAYAAVNSVPSLAMVERAERAMLLYRGAEFQHILSTTDDKMAAQEKVMQEQKALADKAFTDYAPLISDQADQANLDAVTTAWNSYLSSNTKVLDFSRQNRNQEAQDLARGEEQTLIDQELIPAVNAWQAYNLQLADEGTTNGKAVSTRASQIITTAIVAMIVIGLGVAFVFSTWLARGMRRTVEMLQATTVRLAQVARSAIEGADRTAMSASSAASASEQMSASVQTVASAIEEMDASIQEIASNAGGAAHVTGLAADEVLQAQEVIQQLGDASREIGSVVALISTIAEQTNLLALNATIEAARAGEAGKGFAVVASEVKDLSHSTSEATGQIADRITNIQDNTAKAVNAMESISTTIATIVERSTSIAGAVEEQSAVTAEIARSLGEASSASSAIAQEVVHLSELANENRTIAADVEVASTEVEQSGRGLTTMVEG